MTTETRQATCEERIDDQRDRFLSDADVLTRAAYDDDLTLTDLRTLKRDHQLDIRADITDQATETLYAYPLSVETMRVVKVTLSTGGPGSWLEAQLDDDGQIVRIEYHFNDWFDHASRTLDGSDFDTAEAFIRNFI